MSKCGHAPMQGCEFLGSWGLSLKKSYWRSAPVSLPQCGSRRWNPCITPCSGTACKPWSQSWPEAGGWHCHSDGWVSSSLTSGDNPTESSTERCTKTILIDRVRPSALMPLMSSSVLILSCYILAMVFWTLASTLLLIVKRMCCITAALFHHSRCWMDWSSKSCWNLNQTHASWHFGGGGFMYEYSFYS